MFDYDSRKYIRIPPELVGDVALHHTKAEGISAKAEAHMREFEDCQRQMKDLYAEIAAKLVAAGVVEEGKPFYLHSQFANELGFAAISFPADVIHNAKRTMN